MPISFISFYQTSSAAPLSGTVSDITFQAHQDNAAGSAHVIQGIASLEPALLSKVGKTTDNVITGINSFTNLANFTSATISDLVLTGSVDFSTAQVSGLSAHMISGISNVTQSISAGSGITITQNGSGESATITIAANSTSDPALSAAVLSAQEAASAAYAYLMILR